MKRVKAKKVRLRPISKIIIACLILFFVVSFCENRAGLIPAEYISNTALSYANNKVNKAVLNKIEKFENTYDIAVKQGGSLTAVNTSSVAITTLKSELSNAVNKELQGSKTGFVPIGDLLNYRLFSGRGFKIPIKLHFTGSAQVELKSEIVTAGINQTKYRLTALITGSVYSASVTTPAGAKFSLEYPVCETVIVGETPNVFLQSDKGSNDGA